MTTAASVQSPEPKRGEATPNGQIGQRLQPRCHSEAGNLKKHQNHPSISSKIAAKIILALSKDRPPPERGKGTEQKRPKIKSKESARRNRTVAPGKGKSITHKKLKKSHCQGPGLQKGKPMRAPSDCTSATSFTIIISSSPSPIAFAAAAVFLPLSHHHHHHHHRRCCCRRRFFCFCSTLVKLVASSSSS